MRLLLHRIGYFVRETVRNVLHSPFLTAVSISTIAVALILIGFFGYLLINAGQLIDEVGKDLRVTVYLEPTVSAEEAEAVRAVVAESDEVEDVVVLTAAEDRARNRALLSAELLAGLDEESVPGSPSLDVALSQKKRTKEDFDHIATWLSSLAKVQHVDDIHFGAENFRIVFSLIEILRLVGAIVSGVILFAAIFFVFSTVKLAVYARRDEIEVLKLVGATDRFIKVPFYLEGLLQGAVGSFVALLIVAFIHLKVQTFVRDEQAINLRLDLLPAGMILWFLVGGVVLGLAGSVFSVGRHLKV
ncbi:MAG: cell division protein FtsX [Myxococcales bacterium]